MNISDNNEVSQREVRLGKLPAKSNRKALLFSDFLKKGVTVPRSFNFWGKRKGFPLRSFGNTEHGCCTIASQALAAMRSERLEQRRTIEISTESVLKTYYAMTGRLYNGGDTGAYETDALDNWRNPDYTFRDMKDRPLTIDAYTRINHYDHEAIRTALFVTAGKGIKVCFNLPLAWSSMTSDYGKEWDLPEGQQMVGQWMPGSWGGHSMFEFSAYNERGFWVEHSWNIPPQFVTWRGAAAYMDEAHWYVDSINSWKKTKVAAAINFSKLASAVNEVSVIKVKG